VKVELHNKGFRELLHDPKLMARMKQSAEAIADAAGDGFEVEEDSDATRARFRVWSATQAARLAEANNAALTRAIDAGRF
jgi:hypothetical protein